MLTYPARLQRTKIGAESSSSYIVHTLCMWEVRALARLHIHVCHIMSRDSLEPSLLLNVINKIFERKITNIF